MRIAILRDCNLSVVPTRDKHKAVSGRASSAINSELRDRFIYQLFILHLPQSNGALNRYHIFVMFEVSAVNTNTRRLL
jgi:hypothetical protein